MTRFESLTTAEPAAWMEALERCRTYDCYHLPQYHALAEEQGGGAARLFAYFEGEYAIALPLLLRPLEETWAADAVPAGWRDATSVYGYAGPVGSHAEIPDEVGRHFRAALEEELRKLRAVTVFSRLHPFIPQHALLAGLGECVPVSRTVSIDLTMSAESQRERYRGSYRSKINRLRHLGITCERDGSGRFLDEFIDIYQETMRRVDAADNYYFPKAYFDRLWETLSEHVQLFVCRHEGRTIGGGLFLICQGIVQYHLGGTRDDALPLSPLKLVLDEVRQWATQQGLHSLHLGGGVTSRPDDSLLRFKLGFSDRTHEFSVWRWVLFPEIERRLFQQKSRWTEQHNLRLTHAGYFPRYRSPTIPCEPTALAAATAEVGA